MLTARNLARTIDGKLIWNDIDLQVMAGDRIALRGPSGSGKTLLMRSLAGLDDIDGGEIRYMNTPLWDWHIPQYRKHVRYIPQNADFISGSVYDSIKLFFSFKVNRDLTLDESRLNRFLEILQLRDSFLRKTADHLSGGEKQLVALIRSLLLEPDVLLLDEPTSNLDAEMVGRAENLVTLWLNSGGRRCFIWTSHDNRQLDRMTKRSIELTHSVH